MSEDPSELQRKIRELEEQIARLKEQSASHNAELQGDGAIAQVGSKAVGKMGILVEGSFQGNIYMGKDPAEDEKRLNLYRRMVMQSTASLPLRGVDVGASDPSQAQQSIGLANVYVDLDTTQQVKLSEKDTRPLAVLEAVIQNKHLVLLGNPGSGKSTFGSFLAHCLAAHVLKPQQGWLKHLNGWPDQEADLLPVIVVSRDFARSHAEKLPANVESRHLLDFIKVRLAAQKLDFAAQPIEKALDAGKAIVLLDGLDEVPTQSQRLFVRDAVRAFIKRYPHCRFLISCRVLSYQQPEKGKPDLRLTELPSFEIAPFDQAKIDRFVTGWYAELRRLGSVSTPDVNPLTARLREAVRRPDLLCLASNPLLLTVMSLVHSHRRRLPDVRTLLFEEMIDILLWCWEEVQENGSKVSPNLRQYLLEAGRTAVDLRGILWKLAYNAHSTIKLDAGGDGLAEISEGCIIKSLAKLKSHDVNQKGELEWAQHVVDLMKKHSCLLIKHQQGFFSFTHRIFQEYLAGAYLTAQIDFSKQILALTQKDLGLWHEPILHAVSRLVYVNGDVNKALTLVSELLPQNTVDTETHWQLAWPAEKILLEIGIRRVHDSIFGQDLLKFSQSRLKSLLESGKLPPTERVRAGNTLAGIEDPRFDPESWYLPRDKTLGFVMIPAGEFIMGSNRFKSEEPRDKVSLSYDFWIAKFPVTVAQFRFFAKDTGNEKKYEDAVGGIDNHPVVNISWFDAIDYCNWLNIKLSTIGNRKGEQESRLWNGIQNRQLRVILPSEAEWEKAARGTDGREFPWGNSIDPGRANYCETSLGSSSPVGVFPGGASPYSLQDTSGNTWEWTRSLYRPYPYQPKDGREALYTEQDYRQQSGKKKNGEEVLYCLRGGSFSYDADYVRCAYRGSVYPVKRLNDIGFRVVVCPLFCAF